MSSALSNLLLGEATFGKIASIVTAILVTIFAIVLFPYLYIEIFGTWKQTVGVISNSPECTFVKDNFNYNCTPIIVKYTVDGKEYTVEDQMGLLSEEKYVKNQQVPVWYEVRNPELVASLTNKVPIRDGKIGLIFLTILLIFVWGWVWITNNFKSISILDGLANTIGILA